MLYSFIKENTYMDSIELMLLSVKLSDLDRVEKATVMMGTAANIDIMKKSGFDTEGLAQARPNDMVVVVDTEDETVLDTVKETIARAMQGDSAKEDKLLTVKTWEEARRHKNDYDVCLISVPGEYAADEARSALNAGKHVFMFSDNVSVEDERSLKQLAHEKGLLMMGPDCGTAMLHGVPFGFANAVPRGNIGIVGASGTGIQEVAVQIAHLGCGISSAVGTGGRDLDERIGAITMLDAIDAMACDPATDVVVVISKPPAPEARERVICRLRGAGKPAVVLFLGSDCCDADFANIHFASDTLEAARIAVMLSTGTAPKPVKSYLPEPFAADVRLIGLYAGGTLACEAAMMAARAMELPCPAHGEEGRMFSCDACEIIDLGDDCYTQGKPHPMIDGESRNRYIRSLGIFNRPTVILADVELGSGSASDPAEGLAEALKELILRNEAVGVEVRCVINLLAVGGDPQNFLQQRAKLEAAGAKVFMGNVEAVRYALALSGYTPVEQPRAEKAQSQGDADPAKPALEAISALLRSEPGVLNIGLHGFADDLEACGKRVIHFAWKPVAGGDKRLRRAIDYLDNYVFAEGPYRTIDEANRAVVEKVQASQPYLVDVLSAKDVCDALKGKTLLHAGPPMRYEDMTSPMQGSCIGAVLFEEWADTEEAARAMLENGEIHFMPCHHAGFVGPMGGITSGNMPVMQVINRAGGNYAYCLMNEGIGAVLRFGAYGPKVIERLRFMRDTLAPVLSAALKTLPEGLALNTLISKAIAMGDEFHQRNIAASMAFLKEMAPLISALDMPGEMKTASIKFLADTDQFFLNVMMATAKSVMDYAATVTEGTIITVMTRNGKDFGVRLSGMEKQWFTGPVNTPVGLYFSGYTMEDGNPDMGDSAITETFGVGGMAMIAAPAVTRFVGTGGFYDALEISNSMSEIVIAHNNMFSIPNWDFKGICNGIDARKVVLTGITPVINTGIAHKKAGLGQIGAGTVHPPMECFTSAILAYARKLGFKE